VDQFAPDSAVLPGRGDAGSGPRVFPPSLLTEPGIAVLWDGQAGGIVNLAAEVAGISNVFRGNGDPVRVWRDLLHLTAVLFPGIPVVGYERGEDLAAALDAGLRVRGDLRVWLHPEIESEPVSI